MHPPFCSQTGGESTMTNIVVVQFSESVLTSMDLAYNLTCTVTEPQDVTVTSPTFGAGYPLTICTVYTIIQYTLLYKNILYMYINQLSGSGSDFLFC